MGSSLHYTTPASQVIHWDARQARLEIDWGDQLGYPCRLIVTAWSAGIGWYSHVGDDDVHQAAFLEDPGIDLLSATDHPAILAWQATIPAAVRQAAANQAEWQFRLVQMANFWPEAKDLLISNPLLLRLLCERCAEPAQLRPLLALKQPVLMARLGLVGTRSAVRLLRRVAIAKITHRDLNLLQQLFTEPELLALLTHQRRLTASLLRILRQYPWLAGSPLLQLFDRIDCAWEQRALKQLIEGCVRMYQTGEERRQLLQCHDYAAVERLHDRWMHQLNRYEQGRLRSGIILTDSVGQPLPFPAPPHPGTEQIQPVTSPQALAEEGARMHHCVRSYTRDVQQGFYYVYHMELPEPITIGLNLRNGRILQVDQIKGESNATPPAAAVTAVHQWFQQVKREEHGLAAS